MPSRCRMSATSSSSVPKSSIDIPSSRPGRCRRPSLAEAEREITERGVYEPVKQLRLANAYPVLQGYKSSAGVGYRVNFEDPIRFASVSVDRRLDAGQRRRPGRPAGAHRRTGQLPRLARRAGVEQVGLLRPVRPDQTQPQGIASQARLRLLPRLRRSAQAGVEQRPGLLQQDRHTAAGAERGVGVHAAGHRGDAAQVQRHAALARRRRRRERIELEHLAVPESRRYALRIAPARWRRPRFRTALGAFFAVVTYRRRRSQRRPRQPQRQFLLRWLRQQRRRQRHRQTLSRLRFDARLRDRRNRRPALCQADVRMDPAALCLRVGRHAGRSPHMDAAGGLCRLHCGPTPVAAAGVATWRAQEVRSISGFRPCTGTK